jgi:tetratricopeptide (TPR) repeat protein
VLAIAPAAADSGKVDQALSKARAALAQGDGIAAEARLRDARAAGASDDTVRALMGEALLAQGNLVRAREWLASERFTPATRARGYRLLGQLEWREGRSPEAGRAFDKALAMAPDDAGLWTDIARLRLSGGEQAQAIEAADRAVALDAGNADALWFRALLIRRQYGLAASLPWFEAALRQAPGDSRILADQATTLGDLGRYGDALAALRAAQKANPSNSVLLYNQAVIAARGGDRALARRLLGRSANRLRDIPGTMLLSAALELDAGNVNLAVATADRLLRRQSGNAAAQVLMARALARSGDAEVVVARFGPSAEADDASPYLRTAVARAYEESGQRHRAVALLSRATSLAPAPASDFAPAVLDVGVDDLLHVDRSLRLVGRHRDADLVTIAFATEHPQDIGAVRHLANVRARNGQWSESARLLEWIAARSGGRDPTLVADLAYARLREGRNVEAARLARKAARLQPANPMVREIVRLTQPPSN